MLGPLESSDDASSFHPVYPALFLPPTQTAALGAVPRPLAPFLALACKCQCGLLGKPHRLKVADPLSQPQCQWFKPRPIPTSPLSGRQIMDAAAAFKSQRECGTQAGHMALEVSRQDPICGHCLPAHFLWTSGSPWSMTPRAGSASRRSQGRCTQPGPAGAQPGDMYTVLIEAQDAGMASLW